MGVDYSALILVGFHFHESILDEKFSKITPAETHMEPRYSPKTGERIEDREVVVEAEEKIYVFNDKKTYGEWPESFWDLVKKITEYCGCIYSKAGYEEYTFVFGAKVREYGMGEGIDGVADGHFFTNNGLILDEVLEVKPELDRIGAKLKELGFEVPEPQVHLCWDIS